jgi:tight adherence protein B
MRRAVAIVPILLALLLPATAGAAQLSIIPTGNPEFPQRSYVLQVDPPVALNPGDVEMRENGRPVHALKVSSAASASAGDFASVLVIDTSLSMKGAAIREAMSAARAFATHRAPGQELGVIGFHGRRRPLLPLTTNDAEIEAALAATPPLGAGTHLYDAVSAAVTELEDENALGGSVVVLSDGADTGSEAGEHEVVERAAEAGVRIFVVGLESGEFDPAPLRGLAEAGEYTAATDPHQLAPIFSRFGAERASEHLVSYRSEAGIAEQVRVTARVDQIAESAETTYKTPGGSPAIAAGSRPTTSGFWGSPIAMIAAGLLVALVFGVAVFMVSKPRRESVVERLARLGVRTAAASQQDSDGRSEVGAAGPLATVESWLAGRSRWQRFEERLEVAGIDTPAIEIVVGSAVATLLAMVLIGAVSPLPPLALLAVAIPFGVHAVIDRKAREVRERFADDLADNLQVVASAIRAGHSMVGALAVVAEEATGPAQTEFRRIVAAERVGVPLEASIRETAHRMDSRDLEQLALVAIIQRETGGNTAEIIDRAIETIRERAELRRMMESLTVQGRLSRVVVTALPLVLMAALAVINPGYLSPLFETGAGQVLLIVCAAMVFAGSLVIKRIVEVRV